jgi:hypothetical protein
MPRLRMDSLNTEWVELIHAFCSDLAYLGLQINHHDDGSFTLERFVPREAKAREAFWRAAHAHAHALESAPRRTWVETFEARNSDCFADMSVFDKDAVSPELEVADFKNQHHRDLLVYLAHSQSVRSHAPVGKRMGFLIWDAGQPRRRPLIGGAVLASPRFSQPLRDRYLGWPVDSQKNRPGYDAVQRAIRLAGLYRMMQLAVAAALPPYNHLRGARLAALAPLTIQGFDAFRDASKTKEGADLAAIVTTTGLSVTGTPFQRHRIVQLCGPGVKGVKEAGGDLYQRIRPLDGEKRPFASFERLLSLETRERVQRAYDSDCPSRAGSQAMALAHVLRRFRLPRSVFDGNEMGVHIAMIGERTRDYLQHGTPRPASERVLLDWGQCVAVWKRGFLPTPEGQKEVAKKKTRIAHARARERRVEAALAVAPEDVLLSRRVAEEFASDSAAAAAADRSNTARSNQEPSLSSPRKSQ